MTQLRGGAPLTLPPKLEWETFPELDDGSAELEKLLRKWAKRKSKEAAQPQVIMRTGFGL